MPVAHKHVRILREALAGLANKTRGPVRDHCCTALLAYAQAIKDTCEHPDKAKLYNCFACIDCGQRFPLKEDVQ